MQGYDDGDRLFGVPMPVSQPQTIMGYERVRLDLGRDVFEALPRDPGRAGGGEGQERKTRRTRRLR